MFFNDFGKELTKNYFGNINRHFSSVFLNCNNLNMKQPVLAENISFAWLVIKSVNLETLFMHTWLHEFVLTRKKQVVIAKYYPA